MNFKALFIYLYHRGICAALDSHHPKGFFNSDKGLDHSKLHCSLQDHDDEFLVDFDLIAHGIRFQHNFSFSSSLYTQRSL